MIYTRRDIVVPYSALGTYVPAMSFRLPNGNYAEKLSITNKDRVAVVQIREDDGDFPLSPETTEQEIPLGFISFVYVTPITGARFRCVDPTGAGTTRLSFTFYI